MVLMDPEVHFINQISDQRISARLSVPNDPTLHINLTMTGFLGFLVVIRSFALEFVSQRIRDTALR